MRHISFALTTDQKVDREERVLWPLGRIYQDGQVNELFLAYRRGYALARSVYLAQVSDGEERQND